MPVCAGQPAPMPSAWRSRQRAYHCSYPGMPGGERQQARHGLGVVGGALGGRAAPPATSTPGIGYPGAVGEGFQRFQRMLDVGLARRTTLVAVVPGGEPDRPVEVLVRSGRTFHGFLDRATS